MSFRARPILIILVVVLVIVAIGAVVYSRIKPDKPEPGTVFDEARVAQRAAASFPAADEDFFHDMDGGMQLTPEEIKGRNTWLVWTGGNDRFWDKMVNASAGALDFLKILSSHPKLTKYSRDNRWEYFGLVNSPCFEKATGPDPKRFNLWLDKRRADCPPEPFENEQKYPGVKVGARGNTVEVGSFYGYETGIVGLRLFPNPDFDEAAAQKWDAEKYYSDQNYYYSKDLVRPYRVGMSCAFCHVGPNPVKPPADPEHPAHDYFLERYRSLRERIADDLRSRQAEGRLRPDADPERLATSLIALADGLQVQWMLDPTLDMAAELDATLRLLGID